MWLVCFWVFGRYVINLCLLFHSMEPLGVLMPFLLCSLIVSVSFQRMLLIGFLLYLHHLWVSSILSVILSERFVVRLICIKSIHYCFCLMTRWLSFPEVEFRLFDQANMYMPGYFRFSFKGGLDMTNHILQFLSIIMGWWNIFRIIFCYKLLELSPALRGLCHI